MNPPIYLRPFDLINNNNNNLYDDDDDDDRN